eukprot:scaffold395_cov243-Pinguiococcus_pyrenoidosus.AAC.32
MLPLGLKSVARSRVWISFVALRCGSNTVTRSRRLLFSASSASLASCRDSHCLDRSCECFSRAVSIVSCFCRSAEAISLARSRETDRRTTSVKSESTHDFSAGLRVSTSSL